MKALGATLLLKTSISSLSKSLVEPYNSYLIKSPDRVPRKEAPIQTWNKILLGKITLNSGIEKLTLSAKKIKPEGAGELFSLRLIPLEKE